MTPFIILVPLLVAIFAIALDRSYSRAKYVAAAAALLSLALFPLVGSGTQSTSWFSVGSTSITLTTSVQPLNSLLLLVVMAIGVLIMVYSWGYMNLPSEQKRYYIEMLAFEAAMLTFAMAGDFIVLFIAWSFLSMTSYLLIGFWSNRERATAAARKAITVVLIGDIALLAAIVMFQNIFGSLQFSVILSGIGGNPVAALPVALLFVAVMAKSAQFPLQEWLADAMEGPTPVSAYLHSSTMVKAGVFIVLVLFPLFQAAGLLQAILVIGAITVSIAIFAAATENHVKRVLAYSTVEELGLMLVAIASNALLAAIYFFFVQSFYKALLFFSAGASMKATDSENLDEIKGMSSNKLLLITTVFGVLALAGFVPFGGFFADVGLDYAFSTNLVTYALISLVSLTTSFFIFRWFFLQARKGANRQAQLNYSATPRSMSYSMAILAVAALASSAVFFLVSGIFTGEGGLPIGSSLTMSDAVIETALVAIGAAIGFFLYLRKRKTAQPNRLTRPAYTARAVNAVYFHFAGFVEAIAEAMDYTDMKINGAFDWVGHFTIGIARGARRFASGSINAYVALFAIGMVVLVIVVVI